MPPWYTARPKKIKIARGARHFLLPKLRVCSSSKLSLLNDAQPFRAPRRAHMGPGLVRKLRRPPHGGYWRGTWRDRARGRMRAGRRRRRRARMMRGSSAPKWRRAALNDARQGGRPRLQKHFPPGHDRPGAVFFERSSASNRKRRAKLLRRRLLMRRLLPAHLRTGRAKRKEGSGGGDRTTRRRARQQ